METQTVPVNQGVFNAILGSVEPLEIAFDKPYWLGIMVNGGAELEPRMALTASPYSLNATSNGGDSPWTISGDDIYYLNGKVGIGTTSPAHKLHVVSNNNGPAIKLVRGNNPSQYIDIGGYYITGRGNDFNFYIDSGKNFLFNTGNVGIGMSSPKSELDVAGAIAINNTEVINSLGQWVGDPTGLQGPQGPKGDKGDQGQKGDKGDKGDTGASLFGLKNGNAY